MQMIVQLGYTMVFALVPLTIVYLFLERYPPTRGQAWPAIHDLLNVLVAPVLQRFSGYVPAIGRFDPTPVVMIASLAVGWTLIAAVLQVLG
jgi:uncharacterized protein YggT (Ycf19 family)